MTMGTRLAVTGCACPRSAFQSPSPRACLALDGISCLESFASSLLQRRLRAKDIRLKQRSGEQAESGEQDGGAATRRKRRDNRRRYVCRVHVMHAFARYGSATPVLCSPRSLRSATPSRSALSVAQRLRYRLHILLCYTDCIHAALRFQRTAMTHRLRADRSTETPMDFEFTSRPSSNTKPVWATSGQDPHTPKKRECLCISCLADANRSCELCNRLEALRFSTNPSPLRIA